MPLRRYQGVIFCVGWMSYASTYFLRKPLGVIKTDLESELKITKPYLGWLDAALLLPYAVMQMLLGPIGDRFGPRKTFGICLLFSALSMFSFGYWSNFYFFAVLLFLNGTAQICGYHGSSTPSFFSFLMLAQCWPNCMKALGSWFPDKIRNSIFGLFGTCAFAGGIIGTGLAVYLQTTFGWRNVFLIPSAIVATLGFVVMLFFKEPAEVNIDVPGKALTKIDRQTKRSCLELWRIPMLAEVAMAVFCLKVVRYCMYMWLPLFLHHQLKYPKSQAGIFSTVFEIGGVIGSALIGLIIDRFFPGRTLVGTGLSALLSAAALVCFILTSEWGQMVNNVFMFLAGMFNCGPDTILGGSVPAQLGEKDGGNAAAASVGFVNGFGSFGTVLEGPIIGLVSTWYGWSGMFYLMILLSLVGSLAILRAAFINARLERNSADYKINDMDA